MLNYPIGLPIEVTDTPNPRRISSLNEARDLVHGMLRARRLSKLRDMLQRLDNVKSDDDAVEAIGALRKLLTAEDLLVSKPAPFVSSRST